jgi:hypothetical protein
MFNIVVILIILSCVAYQFFLGSFVKSFVMLITSLCATAVAFGYFEVLSNILISRDMLAPWAQSISFLVLFAVTFAVLQIIAIRLTRWPINFGTVADRIGRVVFALISGIIISGALVTALAMAPLSNNLPYQRFDAKKPDAAKPKRLLSNADGFATKCFNLLSSGSLGGKRSFAALHPDFLDQVFLNRHSIGDGVPIIAGNKAIKVPKDEGLWSAPKELKDSTGNIIPKKSGHSLMIARIGITMEAVKKGKQFTPSQLRLVCKPKSDARKPLTGKGVNVYPIGYLKSANLLQLKKLTDKIEIERSDIGGKQRWIDFAFYVPKNYVPVLAEFRQGTVIEVSAPVSAEQAPAAEYFVQRSKCATNSVQLQPATSAIIYGIELAATTNFLTGLSFNIEDPNHWQTIEDPNSIKPAQFENNTVKNVLAELKIDKLLEIKTKKSQANAQPRVARTTADGKRVFRKPRSYVKKSDRVRAKGILGMLETPEGYELLSLRCNNPPVGPSITSEQLPVLVEPSGEVHHPMGFVGLGKTDEGYICEFDYCSVPADQTNGCLTMTEQGSVAKSFPDSIWLPEKAQEIIGFHLLYMVKSGNNTIILSVRPADSDIEAGFKGFEGFLIK